MKTNKKGLQKVTALLLATIMILSAFAMMPNDIFKASAAGASLDDRLELNFNNNWKFFYGDESGAYAKAYDDSAWETVELPHDFSMNQTFNDESEMQVEGESGNLAGGTGWYRKTFTMSSDARDRAVILNFDGAYKDTYVYVNGKLIGENHYGYNSFSFDISEYLVCNGETANIIAVKVEHQLFSSRWYSGSGITRDVTLTIVDPVHVDLYGTYVTTPNLEGSNGADGTVNAKISLINEFPGTKNVVVKAEILDSTGAVVGTSATSSTITMTANSKQEVTLTPVLENPALWNSWDLGTPNLYTLRTTISENGNVIDTYDTEFGYRWFNWTKANGFSLNGKNVKFEGVCMHHDQGALGASQEYDAIYRQVMILKDMGCNAIRTSHGTPSRVFMDICNQVGMLVMVEFFDGWDTAKNGNSNDFSVYFDEVIDTATNEILGAEADMMWYEFVVTQSIKRDRNDPSVFSWDVGNELNEGASTGNFTTIAQNLQTLIDALDPRPILQGNNGPSDSAKTAVDGFMDVIGGNYNTDSWINVMTGTSDSRNTKPYVGTETASATSTRGAYDTLSHYNFVASGYDTDCVSWGQKAAAAWYKTVIYDWNAGEFVWTGFDYIGEPTHWNSHLGIDSATQHGSGAPNSSYFGIVDTAGFAKDTYYLYRSMWNEHSTTLHLVPGTWDSSELAKNGNYAYVAVYSNAAKIELLGNGNVIASAQSTTTTTSAGHKYQTWTETANNSNVNTTEFYTGDGNDLYPQFQVNYSAFNTISVKAYDADGNDITSSAVGTKSVSNTTATKIVPTTWADASTTYTADGDSFIYVEYTAQDANGNFDATYNGTINVTLHGNEAVFVGVDNGDQTATQRFQQPSVFTGENTVQVPMFNGKALVVLRTNENIGNVEITTTAADGIAVEGLTFTTVAEDDTKGEDLDEFEEAMPQPENLRYVPTQYDEWEIMRNELIGDDGNSLEADYTLYSANPEGTTRINMDIPDGWYIITGSDDQGGGYSSGVLTHTTHASGGFTSDGTTGVPAADSDTWYFQKVSDGAYYVYYEDANGNKQYLTISNNQVYVSTAAYPLDVTTDTAGNVTIGFGSAYLNYSGGTSQQVNYYSTATDLKLYYVDESGNGSSEVTTTKSLEQMTVGSSLLDSGWYVLYGSASDITVGSITHTAHTDSTGGLTTTGTSGTPSVTADAWYFEKRSNGTYYVYYTDDDGTKHYMNISSSNYGLSVSTTAQALTVAASSGGITIGANGQYVNFCGNSNHGNHAITWSSASTVTVYKVVETTGGATTTVTQVADTSALNGEYIITGSDDQGRYTYGATTHTLKTGGLTPSNTNAPYTADDNNTWMIEPTTGGYYVYFDDNGTRKYMAVTDGAVSLSTSPTVLTITSNGGTAVIGDSTNTYQLNYYGNSSSVVSEWNPGTPLTFYKVETVTASADGVTMWFPTASDEPAPPVENGEYVIYNNSYIAGGTQVSNSAGTYTGLERVAETPVNNVITTLRADAYTFTLVDGTTNQYYITNSEGKYITMGSGNGTVTLTDTQTALNVYGTSDNRVVIYKGSYNFDNFQDANNMFSCWSGSYTSAGSNQIMSLYKTDSSSGSGVAVPAGKEDLYEALVEAVQVVPGTYSNASYQPLFTALEDGYAVFKDENASADQIAAATAAIATAMAGLEVEYKSLPTTLYKYGYNASATGTNRYANGGTTFNTLTYADTKAMLEDANGPYLAQIKAAIGYDTNTWASDSEKATALETAIDKYARIYSISFTGAPVTNTTTVTDFAKTAWNVWCKTDTQGASESTEEGASVQGIFSALREDGQPVNHAAYESLPYGNHIDNTNRADFNTADGISVSLTINGTATSVTLPALEDISININDMFKKELVDADGNVVSGYDATKNYAKFYWDLQFPLQTTTNEYGINTYTYKSSDTGYLFQASFDDANQTATAQLTPVDSWNISRDSKAAGTGFFPFNYQQGVTSYTGENAIYHYAMNYDMEFYIPMSGTYADGEDVIFEFSGDDDVLVYIDDVLVLDNGGLHGARKASINFTNASVSYQYAMDVGDTEVESTEENGVMYYYGQTAADGLNGDELAAVEKLNEVRSDGDYHTFSFYYVERGSTDSNCEMTFNLQQSSEHVLLHDQTVVVDFGLPVADFNITVDNFVSDDAKAAGTKIDLLGVMAGNKPVADIVNFDADEVEQGLDSMFSATNTKLDVNEMKYGAASVTRTDNEYIDDAVVSYTPNTVNFAGSDYFYICSEVTDDPTYAEGTVYYQYEKVSFIPATSIYFEDNFAGTGLSFTDGTAGDGSNVGKWEVVGDASLFADATQAADLVEDAGANPYGFDPVYSGADDTKDYTQYSGFSAHKVTVSAQNNKKNGGTNPTFEFTFTGTGFDVVSLTDKTTGVFYMEIFDKAGNRVGKRNVVDTYYGYSYGQLYADVNGEATLTETETPLYKSADNEATTRETTYYATDDTGAMIVTRDVAEALYLDVSGAGYSETPTYYDADGNLTTTETEEVAYAYAYAYGWIPAEGDVTGLYQIPVIKKTGLDYGTYRVVLTAMYTSMFDNTGAGQFDLYVDGIRIYDPAGKDDAIADSNILTDYKYDSESYPDYIEFRDMLIGADSLSKDATTQGVVFIDGIAALDNDLDKLKLAGPNNELYLASTPTQQAVAFELWATAVPDEVQIGVKAASGTPKLKVTYADASGEKEIKTATEMNYIINEILPDGSLLTWSEVVVDGVTYYRTNTIVIQNASDTDSILSLTNIKWTFTGVGQYGHYEASVEETASVMSFMSTEATVSEAYSMIKVDAPVVDEPTTDEPADDEVDTEIIPGDDDDVNDTNDEYQEELSWIQKIIKSIADFFKKLFGMD